MRVAHHHGLALRFRVGRRRRRHGAQERLLLGEGQVQARHHRVVRHHNCLLLQDFGPAVSVISISMIH